MKIDTMTSSYEKYLNPIDVFQLRGPHTTKSSTIPCVISSYSITNIFPGFSYYTSFLLNDTDFIKEMKREFDDDIVPLSFLGVFSCNFGSFTIIEKTKFSSLTNKTHRYRITLTFPSPILMCGVRNYDTLTSLFERYDNIVKLIIEPRKNNPWKLARRIYLKFHGDTSSHDFFLEKLLPEILPWERKFLFVEKLTIPSKNEMEIISYISSMYNSFDTSPVELSENKIEYWKKTIEHLSEILDEKKKIYDFEYEIEPYTDIETQCFVVETESGYEYVGSWIERMAERELLKPNGYHAFPKKPEYMTNLPDTTRYI